ncbi:MAG: hypothetical protein KC501_26740 [Myxococcales bacterium]|nr:hypothetical protein [Myxococcales bacterium]
MSDSTRQGPQGPDEVEVEESGLPLAIAHKFGPDITRALAGGPGPYEVNVSFGDGRPSDDELEAVGLFAIPGGDMASGEITRDDLLRLALHPSVLEVTGWATSTLR